MGKDLTLDAAIRAVLMTALDRRLVTITQVAAASQIARYRWRDIGCVNIGYIKGMALVYARVYCKLKASDPAATEMAKASTGDADRDALAFYDKEFKAAGMSNNLAGVDTLRHLFILLIGLGVRESSGCYLKGAYKHNTAETSEAGFFQTSYDVRYGVGTPGKELMEKLFTDYSTNTSGFVEVFKEGVESKCVKSTNYGTGDGRKFQ